MRARARRPWLALLLVVLLLPGAPARVPARLSGAGTPNAWSPTAAMRLPGGRTALGLPDGRALVLGDTGGQVYDPRRGTWTLTAPAPRRTTSRDGYGSAGYTVTLLGNGAVLVAGGATDGMFGQATPCHPATAGAARSTRSGLPAARAARWSAGRPSTGTLRRRRPSPTGGGRPPAAPHGPPPPPAPLCTADLYDPRANKWTATGTMASGRLGHTATLLRNGTVLVAGGDRSCADAGCTTTATAELYDPRIGRWRATGRMHGAHRNHRAIRLTDGRVLILQPGASPDAEVYDPRTGRWTVTQGLPLVRSSYAETLLPNGLVLVAGGRDGDYLPTATAVLYDPRRSRWSPTGSLVQARTNQTATLLPSGLALVTGGCCTDLTLESMAGENLHTAELYDPRTGSWALAPPLATARVDAVAALLANGRVLVAGGGAAPAGPTSAEVYTPGPRPRIGLSPARLDFGNQRTGTTGAARAITVTNISTATVRIDALDAGRAARDFPVTDSCAGAGLAPRAACAVSIRFTPVRRGARGGVLSVRDSGAGAAERTFDSLAGFGTAPRTWAPAGRLRTPRVGHTATLLRNGTVLVAGGDNSRLPQTLASAELYDPHSRQWTATGAMSTARAYHTATLLADGRVLVAGGCTTPLLSASCGPAGPTASAALYDARTGRWTATARMGVTRLFQTATVLPNGKVLVAGGCGDPGCATARASAELYDPHTGQWTATGRMRVARGAHAATLLPTGHVLVAGGRNPAALGSAELYDPARGAWRASGALPAPRSGFTATLLPTGQVLAAGGGGADDALASAALYDPVAGTWSATGPLSSAHGAHTATLLPDGRVLVTGGSTTCIACTSGVSEVYVPSAGSWRVTDHLRMTRADHTATLLPDGTVLVAGGQSEELATPSAEVYLTR